MTFATPNKSLDRTKFEIFTGNLKINFSMKLRTISITSYFNLKSFKHQSRKTFCEFLIFLKHDTKLALQMSIIALYVTSFPCKNN